ncbi:N-acetylmuramoyl-L-alanine amidase [Sporosarcina sp. ACRSL]|uniref:N-acetylmuramoyl-L-alanine amidase n=1 Tax=Sporosarcina sp. ACRSL TaxID=2918215 RepID=UPI001EF429A0|nr:N-acetylmuramoyl-L-alanine amidase [Sporosarcina sp. ACRSL]MCG7345295.1 N-acetylmuramoyl-L-alanine amidase [Sporosarcina sp. ACRSL]
MSFVEQLAPFAIKHGRTNGVLPSLIIAQGIVESASGASELAVNARNLFGIKAGAGWKGEVYTKRTAEQKPDGTVYHIDADFRKYPSYEGCVIDLVRKYTHGTGWESHNRYAAVLNQTDYREVTAAVFAAGYATDVRYPAKLNDCIGRYELTKYDKDGDKVVKIALDAGHGINTPGKRTPDGEFEWTFNNAVLLACVERLNTYQDVSILRLDDPTGRTDVPLRKRTDKANAWGADVLVSIHHNADKGVWATHGGVETYVAPNASKASRDIAAIVHPRIVAAMGLRNRGVKTKNLHMTRESRMPAILTEGGFMDSTVDIKAMRNPAKLKAQGYAIADGLATYFKLRKKPVASSHTPAKEADDMQFTSGTLRKEWETFLGSKAQREIAVRAAVDAGYSESWIKKLADGNIADGDVAALAVGALIRANK